MAKSKLRVGIIGTGGIANGKHMPNLAKQPEVEMVAFCDIVEDGRAEKAAEKFGVKGAAVYTDYQKMLVKEKLDVVHVCTPNRTHAECTVAALESGAHVMSEKPMNKTAEGARKMLEASIKTGKKLTIGYQNRQRDDSLYAKSVVEAGDLGDIYFAKAHAIRRRAVPTWGVFLNEFEQGGGPLIDIGTHALDLTLWIIQNYEPEYVVGTAYKKIGKLKGQANPWGSWNPKDFTVEDSAFGFIKFKNGATVFLESAWAINMRQAGEGICTLCGTKAGLDMWDGLHIVGDKYGRMYDENIKLGAGGVAFYEGVGSDPAEREAHAWIQAIVKDKEPFVKPKEAYVVSLILEKIYKSNESGKPEYFPELKTL